MSEIPRAIALTISSGESLSTSFEMAGIAAGGVLFPGTWTAANLAVLGSINGTDFFDLMDQFGNLITITAAAGDAAMFSMSEPWSVPYIKFRSVSTADSTAAVNQAAARTLMVLCR